MIGRTARRSPHLTVSELPWLAGRRVTRSNVGPRQRRRCVRLRWHSTQVANALVRPLKAPVTAWGPRTINSARLVVVVVIATSCTRSGGPDVGRPLTPSSVHCGYGGFSAGHWPTSCWRPFSDNSIFNRPVPAVPSVLANSSQVVDQVLGMAQLTNPYTGAADTGADWYDPIYWAQAGDPVYTIHCTKTWGECPIEGMRISVPGPARPSASADGHLSVIDQRSGWEYDFWQASKPSTTGGVLTASWGGRTMVTGDGLASAASAAGQGLVGGLIRAQELEAGRVDHALVMSVKCTGPHYVYPAVGNASTCPDTSNAPPTGQWFYLDMTDGEIDSLDAPAWKRAILTALAHYGSYITDTGGAISLVAFESGSSYSSFGSVDPLVTFAQQHSAAIVQHNGLYYFDLASGVDWRRRLRALSPPAPQG
jgi:hypothetical protein